MTNERRPATGAIAAALIGMILLDGCAATRPSRSLTPDEERMRAQASDFDRTMAEGVIGGALIGAVLGAGIGALSKPKNRGKGALVGAGIGGASGAIIGGVAGKYYADKKAQYASAEQRLDAIIADLHTQNTSLAALVDSTRTVVQADQQKLSRIQEDLATQRITRAEADRQLASVDDNRRVLEQTVRDLKDRKSEWVEVAAAARADGAAAPKIATLDAEIATLESRIVAMETELAALSSRRASVVG